MRDSGGSGGRAAATRGGEAFKVGDASVIRRGAIYEESGRTQLPTSGRDKRSKLNPHRNWLPALRRRENDLKLAAVAVRLVQ